jgi:hypothetical protein
MKTTTHNRKTSRISGAWRPATFSALGLVFLMSSASAQMPGFGSEDDWVGTLPNIHVDPEDAGRSGIGQGVSTFYIEGPWRQILGAAMQAGGNYVSIEVLPNEEFRAVFHGDQFLAFDLELFEESNIRCGMRTESGAGLVALQVGGRLLRSQPLTGDLRIPVKRLNDVGALDGGVVLHAYDPLAGRSRTSVRTIGGRLYLFQTS